MKLRLVADGSVCGTRVVDVDTGRTIDCAAVRFEHRAGDIPKLELELQMIETEGDGVVHRFYIPTIGYVRAVELEDGTHVDLPKLHTSEVP